jgi:hypothetical protein
MRIDIADQRKGDKVVPLLHIDSDLVEAYCGLAGVDLSGSGTLKIRFRDWKPGLPYGHTETPSADGSFRVVIHINYSKLSLSESASYVVSNTLLHELRHVAQGQEKGWGALSGDYHGWSETEAREYGRLIKGDQSMYAVR